MVMTPGYESGLRVWTPPGSSAALMHLGRGLYRCQDGTLRRADEVVPFMDVMRLAQNPRGISPVDDPLLLLGIFSFLYQHGWLHEGFEWNVSVHTLSRYLGHYTGTKGYPLVSRLKAYAPVYGVLTSEGRVYPALEVVGEHGNHIRLRSEYLHRYLHCVLRDHSGLQGGGKGAPKESRGLPFYIDKVFATLVAARDPIAALIVMEVTKVVVKTGLRNEMAHLSLKTLTGRVPELDAILYAPERAATRTVRLRQLLGRVRRLLLTHTSLPADYPGLRVDMPLRKDGQQSVIEVWHTPPKFSRSRRPGGASKQKEVSDNGESQQPVR